MTQNLCKHSVADCLAALGVNTTIFFQDANSLDDEFKLLKRCYFQKVLKEHPDKGGSTEQFLQTQTSFEVLRELYSKGQVKKGGFGAYLNSVGKNETATDWDSIFKEFSNAEVPSYEFYAEAATSDVPGYLVERARSGRSKCTKCQNQRITRRNILPRNTAQLEVTYTDPCIVDGIEKKRSTNRTRSSTDIVAANATTNALTIKNSASTFQLIQNNDLRVGSLDSRSGTYGRWHHLVCWRVPSRVWLGLTEPGNLEMVLQDLLYMDEVLLKGFGDLDEEMKLSFVQHVMDKSHWTKKIAVTTHSNAVEEGMPNATMSQLKRTKIERSPIANEIENSIVRIQSSTDIITTKEHFVIPRPGRNGAVGSEFLNDKRFCLTGIFPEIGGGTGLNLGKDKTKQMIETFGGVVTSCVSGKTNYLVIGKDPGGSKVGIARAKGTKMIDLRTLQKLLLHETTIDEIEALKAPRIERFSAGYVSGRRIGM